MANTYGITYSYTDTTSDAGTYWGFPEDPQMSWEEACAEAMRSALNSTHNGSYMEIEGHDIPCQLGCENEDGTPIPDGECGEPRERRFRITVTDDESRQTFAVT